MTPSHGSRGPGGLDPTALDRVLDHLDARRIVDLTRRLVAVQSLPGEEGPGQDVAADLLAGAGMEVERFATPEAELVDHPYYSAEVERGTLDGVIGWLGGDGAGTGLPRPAADALGAVDPAPAGLLIDGHIDVVPLGDPARWSVDPWDASVIDGRVTGRGSCDMKGGIAAAIAAVEAIGAAGITLARPLAVSTVVGEEDGGSGTLALLERGIRADAVLIPEPTELTVVPTVAGALSWRLHVPGRAAHGCLREEGVSAIEVFRVVQDAVLAFETRRNAAVDDPLFSWLERPFAICGGRLFAGDWASSEADHLVWEGRYGVAPGEDEAVARAAFEQVVAEAAAAHPFLASNPPRVEWWGGQFHAAATDPGTPIVTSARDAVGAELRADAIVRGMPYGCDAGLTAGYAGLPTVVLGPGDIRDAHTADESVAVSELLAAARIDARLILATCGIA